MASTLFDCRVPSAAPRVGGSGAARNHARLAQASLLGLALGARDLAEVAAFVRLTWLDALEVRVESVVDERMEALASAAAVEHLQPWTTALTPAVLQRMAASPDPTDPQRWVRAQPHRYRLHDGDLPGSLDAVTTVHQAASSS